MGVIFDLLPTKAVRWLLCTLIYSCTYLQEVTIKDEQITKSLHNYLHVLPLTGIKMIGSCFIKFNQLTQGFKGMVGYFLTLWMGKLMFFGIFFTTELQSWKGKNYWEDCASKLSWRLSFSYHLPVVEKYLKYPYRYISIQNNQCISTIYKNYIVQGKSIRNHGSNIFYLFFAEKFLVIQTNIHKLIDVILGKRCIQKQNKRIHDREVMFNPWCWMWDNANLKCLFYKHTVNLAWTL